ncbi:MAG: extracellular solute-binding protein, partial [Halovenus sp.]
MGDNHSADGDRTGSSVSRRTFVKAAGGTGVAMSLAGCGGGGNGNGNGNGNGSGTVTIAMGSTTISDIEENMPDLLHENGVDDDIDIEFNSQDDDTGEQRDQYITLLQAQESSPDLFMVDNGWANILIGRGLLTNATEALSDDVVSTIDDEYFGPFTETVRGEDGDLYGVPLFPDFGSILYNKEYAREAGYDDDDFETWATEPMTWSEWAELVE